MQRYFITPLLAFGLSLLPLTSYAGARIDFSVDQANRANDYAVLMDNGKVRVLDQTARSNGLIFDANSGQMVLLDHQSKTYLVLTQARINEISSMVETLGQIAQQQGGVLGDLFSTFGLDSDVGEPDNITLISPQTTDTIAGQNCQHLQVKRNDQLETTLCIAKNLPINAEDKQTLGRLLDFSQQLANKAGSLLNTLGLSLPLLPEKSLEGFPLGAESKKDSLYTRVSKIASEPVDASLFVIPAGYSQKKLPI